MSDNPQDLKDDLLKGLAAIGNFIGENERTTQYLAERGYIPVFRPGNSKIIHARKSELVAHYSSKSGGA